jgi:hypothetical protein
MIRRFDLVGRGSSIVVRSPLMPSAIVGRTTINDPRPTIND